MNEHWQELKETIIEMRDNDGTGTQQEVCKFLANLMDVLEKQMRGSENPNKWIPVSERLPEESLNSVIGWDDYREKCVFVQYIDGYFQIIGSASPVDIVAWMPLPKPYEPQERSEE